MGKMFDNPLVAFLVMVIVIMAGFLAVKFLVGMIPDSAPSPIVALKKVVKSA